MLHKKAAVCHLHHGEDDLAAAHHWLRALLAGPAAGPIFRYAEPDPAEPLKTLLCLRCMIVHD